MHFEGWVWIATFYSVGVTKSGFAGKMEGRDCILMHAFSVMSSFYSYFTLSFLYLISLSILSVSCLSLSLASIYGYCSYLYWVNHMEFLSFTHIAHQLFLSAMNTSSRLPTNLLVVWPPLHLGMPNTFSLFHYSFHDKSLSVWIYREPFSLIRMGKTLGLSLPISLTYIKWSQPFTAYFGQRCIPSRTPPRRGLDWIPKISHFLPPTKPHPL